MGEIVSEPLAIHEPGLSRAKRRERAIEILEAVGMGADALDRYPHEFSGGQRQRIGIARALILRPELVIADEPVSALDVSVGAQILELLARLQREFSLTLILISHSLPVVAQLATRVAVMKAGRFVEIGAAEKVLTAPEDAYTQSLLAAVPQIPGRRRKREIGKLKLGKAGRGGKIALEDSRWRIRTRKTPPFAKTAKDGAPGQSRYPMSQVCASSPNSGRPPSEHEKP